MLLQIVRYRRRIRGLSLSKERAGQVSIEAAFAFIVAILLLLGAAYIFVWMNKSIVEREEYQRKSVDGKYTPKPLKIFGASGD